MAHYVYCLGVKTYQSWFLTKDENRDGNFIIRVGETSKTPYARAKEESINGVEWHPVHSFQVENEKIARKIEAEILKVFKARYQIRVGHTDQFDIGKLRHHDTIINSMEEIKESIVNPTQDLFSHVEVDKPSKQAVKTSGGNKATPKPSRYSVYDTFRDWRLYVCALLEIGPSTGLSLQESRFPEKSKTSVQAYAKNLANAGILEIVGKESTENRLIGRPGHIYYVSDDASERFLEDKPEKQSPNINGKAVEKPPISTTSPPMLKSKSRKVIKDFLDENKGWYRIREIAKAVGCSYGVSKQRTRELYADEEIDRKGIAESGYFYSQLAKDYSESSLLEDEPVPDDKGEQTVVVESPDTEPIEILSKSKFKGKLKYTLMSPSGDVLAVVAASDEDAFRIYREKGGIQ